jgi:hypothetical protein
MDERMILSRINVTGDFRFLNQPQAHLPAEFFINIIRRRAFDTSLNMQAH